jgi:hypothetical protein
MKKLFMLFVLLFIFSILISVSKDFNSKVKISVGAEKVHALLPPPPPY